MYNNIKEPVTGKSLLNQAILYITHSQTYVST